MIRPARTGIALVAAVIAIGCAGHTAGRSAGSPAQERTAILQRDLARLVADAGSEESETLAAEAIQQSRALAAEYRLAHPPLFHNLLVNLGLKQRGLCWHWTEDLLNRLRELPLSSYQLHWGIAHRGVLFREHNSVIVTARGRDIESGIVLDPWRNSGELYWAPVADDSYPWEPYATR